eukprot:1161802-Pelagomonas_calceolata.AAC.22
MHAQGAVQPTAGDGTRFSRAVHPQSLYTSQPAAPSGQCQICVHEHQHPQAPLSKALYHHKQNCQQRRCTEARTL